MVTDVGGARHSRTGWASGSLSVLRAVTCALALLTCSLLGAASAAASTNPWVHPVGALDPGFGSGGVQLAHLSATEAEAEGNDFPSSAALQGDKILMLSGDSYFCSSGANGSCTSIYLTRFLPNGTRDSSFGGDGIVTLPTEGYDYYSLVTTDSLGRIILVAGDTFGVTENYPVVVLRLHSDGTPDLSFGPEGKVKVHVPTPPAALRTGAIAPEPVAVTTAPDDSVTVAGNYQAVCSESSAFVGFIGGTFVARVGSDGSLVSSFGSKGVITTAGACEASPENVSGMTTTASNSVVVVGYTKVSSSDISVPTSAFLRAYSSAGALANEASISSAGAGWYTLRPARVVALSDGKLLVTGWTYYNAPKSTRGRLAEFLARYNANGQLDSSFGEGGVDLIPTWPAGGEEGTLIPRAPIVVLADGDILVGGQAFNDLAMAVTRYTPAGLVDPSFGESGTAFAGANESWNAEVLTEMLALNGQPLTIGMSWTLNPGESGGRENEWQTPTLTLFRADGRGSAEPPETGGRDPGVTAPPGGGSGGSLSLGAGHQATGTGSRLDPTPAALATLLGHRRFESGVVLRTAGCSLSFDAPGPGVLTVQWTTIAAPAGGRIRNRATPVVVARGSTRFSAAGHGMVRMRLTTTGRQLLKRGVTIRLLARASFRPAIGTTITQQSVVLVRGHRRKSAARSSQIAAPWRHRAA
jgi:uncharacterized delta-60 repeat protein